MRDLFNNVNVVSGMNSIVVNDDTEGTGLTVDLQGYDSAMAVVNVGAEGDTLSGSVKFDLKIQHGDLSDGSDMAGVTDQYQLIGVSADLTAGIFATIDDNAEAPAVHRIGYRGPKRYVRIFADTTGTHTNGTPMGIVWLRNHAAVNIG